MATSSRVSRGSQGDAMRTAYAVSNRESAMLSENVHLTDSEKGEAIQGARLVPSVPPSIREMAMLYRGVRYGIAVTDREMAMLSMRCGSLPQNQTGKWRCYTRYADGVRKTNLQC